MPGKPTDVRPVAAALYFLPIKTRMPLKFGPEITTEVTCARVRLTVADARGPHGRGLGRDAAERPVGLAERARRYEERHEVAEAFCERPGRGLGAASTSVGPPDRGRARVPSSRSCPACSTRFNRDRARAGAEPMPWLAALVCCSAFDLALHDAYGVLARRPDLSRPTTPSS